MNIKVNLLVRLKGAVLSWEVKLENTNSNSRVMGFSYNSTKEGYERTIYNFPINDNVLDVYIGCEGRIGGEAECEVTINDIKQSLKATCKNDDPNYGHQSYKI